MGRRIFSCWFHGARAGMNYGSPDRIGRRRRRGAHRYSGRGLSRECLLAARRKCLQRRNGRVLCT